MSLDEIIAGSEEDNIFDRAEDDELDQFIPPQQRTGTFAIGSDIRRAIENDDYGEGVGGKSKDNKLEPKSLPRLDESDEESPYIETKDS